MQDGAASKRGVEKASTERGRKRLACSNKGRHGAGNVRVRGNAFLQFPMEPDCRRKKEDGNTIEAQIILIGIVLGGARVIPRDDKECLLVPRFA